MCFQTWARDTPRIEESFSRVPYLRYERAAGTLDEVVFDLR